MVYFHNFASKTRPVYFSYHLNILRSVEHITKTLSMTLEVLLSIVTLVY